MQTLIKGEIEGERKYIKNIKKKFFYFFKYIDGNYLKIKKKEKNKKKKINSIIS